MNFFRKIKDFANFYREYNTPQSRKYQNITDFLYDFFTQDEIKFELEEVSRHKSELDKILSQYKIEKEYSDLKYKLADQYKSEYLKYEYYKNAIIDIATTSYYKNFNEILFDDLKEVIEWIPSSKYRNDEDLKMINKINDIFSKSDIKKDLDDFTSDLGL